MQSFRNAGGYPWGILPTALIAATGAAQIGRDQGGFFGGGSAAPSLSGSGGGSQTVITVPIGSSDQPVQQSQLQVVNVRIVGGTHDANTVRELIEAIN